MSDFHYFRCFRRFFIFHMFTENNKGRGVLVRIFLIPPVFYGIPLIPLFPIIGNLAHSKGLLGDVLGSVARGRSHRLSGDDAAGPARKESRSANEKREREEERRVGKEGGSTGRIWWGR